MVIIHKKHKETAEEKEIRKGKERERAMGIQDEYQARGFELVSWVQEHKVLVSVVIAVLLLAGALFSAFLYYQKRSGEIASGAYLEAVKSVENLQPTGGENAQKWKDAKTSLEEIANHYKRSGVAVLASLYAAHIALEGSEAKEAISLYQKAIKDMKKSDALYPLALIGFAYAQEKDGDLTGALASFQSVVDMKDAPGKDLAQKEVDRLSKDKSAN